MAWWGGVRGKERNTYTHAWQWMDALRCAATQCDGMEMGRDFAVVVSCFFLFLVG